MTDPTITEDPVENDEPVIESHPVKFWYCARCSMRRATLGGLKRNGCRHVGGRYTQTTSNFRGWTQ